MDDRIAHAELDRVKEFNEPLRRRFDRVETVHKAMMGAAEPVKVELDIEAR